MRQATKHLSHPILRLEVLGADGTRSDEQRVFCRYQNRSVPVGVCCGCVHCDAITTGRAPSVECTVPAEPEPATPDPDGERTQVGALLHEGALAIEPTASLREALEILRSGVHRSIPVVDERRVLVGVVHEISLVRPRQLRTPDPEGNEVSAAMSTALAIHEAVPIRRALYLLASSHVREATVVNDGGIPIGVFRDVEGLSFIAHAHKASAE